MRVISLYEPYATLMAMGLKTIETRSWDTNYRGPLLIHATQTMPRWCKDILDKDPFRYALAGVRLSSGCIVGQVQVVGTKPAHIAENEMIVKAGFEPMPDEYYFGDYSRGRFAWQTINPVRFVNPLPAKGSQGFWNFDINIIPGFV